MGNWRNRDPEKVKAFRHRWYVKNRQKVYANRDETRLRLRQWFEEIKRQYPCSRCPENEPYCIDFHHLDDTTKEDCVAKLVNRGVSRQRILDEIAKCIPLCSNCHRKEHRRIAQLAEQAALNR